MYSVTKHFFRRGLSSSFFFYQKALPSSSCLTYYQKKFYSTKEPLTLIHKGMENLESPFNQGIISFSSGHYDEAFRYFEQALSIAQRSEKGQHPDPEVIYFNLGLCAEKMNHLSDAAEYYQKSYIEASDVGEHSYDVLMAAMNADVNLYLEKKDLETALEVASEMVNLSKFFEEDDIFTIMAHGLLGKVHLRSRNYDLAVTHLQRAYTSFKDLRRFHKEMFASLCVDLGNALLKTGQMELGMDYLRKGADMMFKMKKIPYNDLIETLTLLTKADADAKAPKEDTHFEGFERVAL